MFFSQSNICNDVLIFFCKQYLCNNVHLFRLDEVVQTANDNQFDIKLL